LFEIIESYLYGLWIDKNSFSKTSGERASGFFWKEISFSFTTVLPSDPIFMIFLKN